MSFRISRRCQDLDDLVEEFRNRPLEEGYPCVQEAPHFQPRATVKHLKEA